MFTVKFEFSENGEENWKEGERHMHQLRDGNVNNPPCSVAAIFIRPLLINQSLFLLGHVVLCDFVMQIKILETALLRDNNLAKHASMYFKSH